MTFHWCRTVFPYQMHRECHRTCQYGILFHIGHSIYSFLGASKLFCQVFMTRNSHFPSGREYHTNGLLSYFSYEDILNSSWWHLIISFSNIDVSYEKESSINMWLMNSFENYWVGKSSAHSFENYVFYISGKVGKSFVHLL